MKPGIIVIVVSGTVLNVMADFAADFQEAKKLFDQKESMKIKSQSRLHRFFGQVAHLRHMQNLLYFH